MTSIYRRNCLYQVTAIFINQFIISRTRAFIFTSPSSDRLRNFSATRALTARNVDSWRSSRLQRRRACGYRLVMYFSRHDNKRLCRLITLCLSTTPAASDKRRYTAYQSIYCILIRAASLCLANIFQLYYTLDLRPKLEPKPWPWVPTSKYMISLTILFNSCIHMFCIKTIDQARRSTLLSCAFIISSRLRRWHWRRLVYKIWRTTVSCSFSALYQLHSISRLAQTAVFQSLVYALVASHLDYWLGYLPISSIALVLQFAQNVAAMALIFTILCYHYYDHILICLSALFAMSAWSNVLQNYSPEPLTAVHQVTEWQMLHTKQCEWASRKIV